MITHESSRTPARSTRSGALKGTVQVPGDKSISHRSLMLASQAIGLTNITGLLEGDDVLHTAGALKLMGIPVSQVSKGHWKVIGHGVGGLMEPSDVLNMGNAGTGARLMMGLVSSYKFNSFFTGDASLRSRPMRRVMTPLSQMGVNFHSHTGDKLPMMVQGSDQLIPISYTLPVASAQVKSAILLAGLNIAGETTVIEPITTRDHTENMLRHFGATVKVEPYGERGRKITLVGQPELKAKDIHVPGDPSSAAFLIVAALLIPDSHLTLENICINPERTGLYTTLKEMGGNIRFINERIVAGEQVADIEVKASELKGINVPAERAASMIDEYPVLSVAASFAKGTTHMEGLEELKVKESNRLQAIADGLIASGIRITVGDSSLTVEGTQGKIPGGSVITTHMDHRIAMSFLVMGMVSEQPISVDDSLFINTSFPGFIELMNRLGGKLEIEKNAA